MIPHLTRIPFVFAFLLAALPAASVAPCPDAWKPAVQAQWDAPREAWNALCATGLDAKAVESRIQEDFVVACLGRSADLLQTKRVSPEAAREACRRGKPGETAQRRQAATAPGEELERARTGIAAFGGQVAAGDVDGIFGETRRRGSVATGGATLVLPGVTIRGAPKGSPQARIDALSYPERVKDYLRAAAQYADPEDMATTLETLEKAKPQLSVNLDGLKEAYGQAWSEGTGSAKRHFIEIAPGSVEDKNGHEFPLTLSAFRREQAARKDAKPRAPPLALTAPGSLRKDLGFVDGEHVYEYADGSKLKLYSQASIAGTFLHEIQHVRRDWQGGAANDFANERDAHDLQYRFYTRYMQAHGGKIPLDPGKKAKLDEWHTDQAKFKEDLIAAYIANGQITPGEVSIAEQAAAARKRLATARAEIANLGNLDRLYYWWKDMTPPAVDAHAEAKEEVAALTRDAALSAESLRRQEEWRKERERNFLVLLDRRLDAQILETRNSRLSPARKKRRIAELEGYRREGRADPWQFIPKLDVP